MFDEYAYVLKVNHHNAYVLGAKYFSALEVILRTDYKPNVGDKVYLGNERRDEIYSIKRKLTQEELNDIDSDILKEFIHKIVSTNETRFVDFINSAGPLSTMRHQLQALPNIGEKYFNKIIQERNVKIFSSISDFDERVEFNILNSITNRIYSELTTEKKLFLFIDKQN